MQDSVVYADSGAWVCSLTIRDHFEALTEQERLYAHWLSNIIFRQNAHLAEEIFDLIIALFIYSKGEWQELAQHAGITASDMNYLLKKYIPQLSVQSFEKLASVSDLTAAKFQIVADIIYLHPQTSLGLPNSRDELVSNYYPGFTDLTKGLLSHVQEALHSASTASENTAYLGLCKNRFGDHNSELAQIIRFLQEAIYYAATEEERLAITSYIESFQTGSILAHKKALEHWVKDRSPIVEALLGFIEYYRDPASVRAEWRGFVMIKNKAESEVFARLAAQAEIYLAILPWLNDFEEDEFIAPDFTSMEALTLVSTTMPAGTNGPNYEDVKRDCGFKNISIRNRVIESSSDNVTFLDAEDKALYARYAVDGFGVIVAFHELIGHGSGKCFTEKSNGQYNFDRDNPPINPLTRQVVKTWYKNGQTAKSIFGSSYEECRAECVALYLALQSESMELFTYADEEKDDVVFVGFLYILRAGLIGLEAWNPITKTWASAHARARFAILKHLLTVAEPAISLKFEKENSPDTDVRLKLDRTKLQSHVLPAIKDLVMRLHIHQCIADRVGGVELYDRLSEVDEKMKSVREIVLKHKSPRKQFVQANTVIVDGKVQLREYEESAAGMIQSWAERDV